MTTSDRKQKIATSFGAAAGTYESAAILQNHAARRLASSVLDLPLPPAFRALEIGAGTGGLTRRICDRLGAREWVITDLSPEMLKHCEASVGRLPNATFRTMDGENPDVEGPFDLIVSNLAFQWFDDLKVALGCLVDLLAPGGHLAFSTMASDSAREWRRAHVRLGLQAGTPSYPTLFQFQAMWPEGGQGQFEDERVVRRYPSGRAFVRTLKHTGALVPAPGHRPLSAANLRRVLREIDLRGDLAITYHLAYGRFTRDGA